MKVHPLHHGVPFHPGFITIVVVIIITIITSNDDLKPSTVLSEQSPTELIAID